MLTEMAQRKEQAQTVGVSLRISVRDKFSEFCRDNGIIQSDLLAKLIGWFMIQDRSVQRLFMGELSEEDNQKAALMVLERLARGENVTAPPPARPGEVEVGPEKMRDVAEVAVEELKRARLQRQQTEVRTDRRRA